MPDENEDGNNAERAARFSAKSPVIPGEDEAFWRETVAGWFDEYDPQTPVSRTLVGEAALAFWLMARNRRQFERIAASLSQKDPFDWKDEDHMKYTRFLRYKTSTDRAFSRAFKDVEYLRKARLSESEALRRVEHQFEKWTLQMTRDEAKLELDHAKFALEERRYDDTRRDKAAVLASPSSKSAAPSAKRSKKEHFDVAEQWVEVTITDGITKTAYVPTNEELLKELEDDEIEPKMVYRRLNFPDGLPPEYAWTNLHDPKTCETTRDGNWCPLCSVHERGGFGVQRMTFATWRKVIEKESKTPGRHAGPTGVGNLPRPKEREGDMPFEEIRDYVAWAEQNRRTPETPGAPGAGQDEPKK